MKSIVALATAYRCHDVSPVEIVRRMLDEIAASTVNAYISVFAEEALREAGLAEQDILAGRGKGILHGVPIAVKDVVYLAGKPTTMGSQQYAGFVPDTDAVVVRQLRRAGAIIMGKANTHEFAYGPTGDRSHFGAVRNPRDERRVAGGSSSGSAAAVAAGLACGAIGTDTSASIRLPAALCGVVGMKASKGLVSTEGVFAVSGTLDHVGPITVNVRDNALLLAVLAGKAEQHYSQDLDKPVRGKVIGIPDSYFFDYVSAPVQKAFDDAIRLLQDAGATVRPVTIPTEQIYQTEQLILKAEAYAGHEAALLASAPYDPEVKARLLTGKDVLAADYLRALRAEASAADSFRQALTGVDALLTPTCGVTAPLLDERRTTLNGQMYPTPWLLTRLTGPTNLSGNPSLSVPFGYGGDELPIGLQLIGREHEEALVYQIAGFLESQTAAPRG